MAVNLLAAEYLCRRDSSVLGVIGAGVQARFHVRGFLAGFSTIGRVKVFNRSPEGARRLADLCRERDGEFVEAPAPDSAAEGSDIVISATTSNEPLIRNRLGKGVTYFHFSGHECEYSAFDGVDRIFTDDWETILHRGHLTPALMHRDGRRNGMRSVIA